MTIRSLIIGFSLGLVTLTAQAGFTTDQTSRKNSPNPSTKTSRDHSTDSTSGVRYEVPTSWAAPSAGLLPGGGSENPFVGASDARHAFPPGPDSLSLALASLSALAALRAGRVAGGLKVRLPSLALQTHAVRDLDFDDYGQISLFMLPVWPNLATNAAAPTIWSPPERPDPLPNSPVLLRLRPRGPPACLPC